MKNINLERLLSSEMESVKGGANTQDVCNCTSGAGAKVIVMQPPTQGGNGGNNKGETGMGGYYV